MRSIARGAAPFCLMLTACAGGQTRYTGVSSGPILRAVDCAVEAIVDEGFRVTSRDNTAGILTAENGAARLDMRVVPGGVRNTFLIRVDASDSEVAREAAQEIVVECGAG